MIEITTVGGSLYEVDSESVTGSPTGLNISANADNGADVSLSLIDNAGGRFAINHVGTVTVDNPNFDYDSAVKHGVTVQAEATGHDTVTARYFIKVSKPEIDPEIHLTPWQRRFIKRIRHRLSGELVDVEISDADILSCLDSATSMFIRKGNNDMRPKIIEIAVQRGQREYDLPESVSVDTIVQVLTPTYGHGLSTTSEDLFVQSAVSDMMETTGGGSFRFLEYELVMGQQETMQKYTANIIDFKHDKRANKLFIFNSVNSSEKWLLDCRLDLEKHEYAEMDWVEQWSYSEALIVLGQAYSKFQSISAPVGQTTLDGGSYIQRARELQERLLEDITNLTDGDGDDFYGVYA